MFWDGALSRDVKGALRQFKRVPLVIGAAVLVLALGIGVTTAVFTLFDTIVFRKLPVADPDGLLLFGTVASTGPRESFSYPAYQHLAQETRPSVSLLASGALGGVDVSISGVSETSLRDVVLVSGDYFSLLGIIPILGRPIQPQDGLAPASTAVAVISERLWKNRFGRNAEAVGRVLAINGTPFTIVGVAPGSFFGTSVGELVDLWLPVEAAVLVTSPQPGRPTLLAEPLANWLTVMGRAKRGVSRASVTRDLDVALTAYLARTFGDSAPRPRPDLLKQRLDVRDGSRGVSWLRTEFGRSLVVLLVVVGIVLLTASANVANLFASQAVDRRKDIAITLALGAGRLQLVRQLFVESLVVAALGAVLGLVVASWSWGVVLAMIVPDRSFVPVIVSLDARILAFTIVISVIVATCCGTAPALYAWRVNVMSLLRDDVGPRRFGVARYADKGLLVVQVALCAGLLVAAGQFVQSFRQLAAVQPGFAVANQIVLRTDASRANLTAERTAPAFEEVRTQLQSQPGVRAVAISDSGFFSGGETRVDVSGLSGGSSCRDTETVLIRAAPKYFATLGVQQLSGRDFSNQDVLGSPRVAIVNETLAQLCFPASTVGSVVGIGSTVGYEIVGVVRDTRYRDLRKQTPPILYLPFAQSPRPIRTPLFTVAAAMPASPALLERLKSAVHTALPQATVTDVNTVVGLVDRTMATDRLLASVSGALGLLAIVLVTCGTYAVIANAVARRARDISVRLALGAQPRRLAASVVGDAVGTVIVGVIVGLLAAGVVIHVSRHFVVGLGANDPLAFGIAALTLVMVAGLSASVPALKAAKADPLSIIRGE